MPPSTEQHTVWPHTLSPSDALLLAPTLPAQPRPPPLRFPRSSSRLEATADQLRVHLPRVPPIDSPEEGAPCCTSERPFLRFNLGRADCGWPALRTTAVPPPAFGY